MTRITVRGFCCVGGLLLLIALLPSCATTELYSTPLIQSWQGATNPGQVSRNPADAALKVMTLNVAHGRGTAFHQLLQYSDKTRENLDNIVALLNDAAPDIIALQEADGRCFWSGNFNHVEYIANRGLIKHSVQAPHVAALGLSYGTALMSRLDLTDPQAVTFDPSFSLMPKGFVVSTIGWPGREGVNIDVVSVHLDFASGSVRKQQADELISILRARNNRVIIMGDLNTEWHQPGSAVQHLAEQLELTAFQPESRDLVTFPAFGERLDWILVSPGLEFYSHAVIDAGVSDHRGVIAELVLSSR